MWISLCKNVSFCKKHKSMIWVRKEFQRDEVRQSAPHTGDRNNIEQRAQSVRRQLEKKRSVCKKIKIFWKFWKNKVKCETNVHKTVSSWTLAWLIFDISQKVSGRESKEEKSRFLIKWWFPDLLRLARIPPPAIRAWWWCHRIRSSLDPKLYQRRLQLRILMLLRWVFNFY